MKKYFGLEQGETLLGELLSKVEEYDKHLSSSGLKSELKKSKETFYSDKNINEYDNKQILKINHYSSLIRSLNSLVTSQKIAWQAIASNTDVVSQQSAILANGLLDTYLRNNRLDRLFKNAALQASFLRESWVQVSWNTEIGNILTVDENQVPIHEGDLDFSLHGLENVIRDYNKKDMNFNWVIVREFKDRFELISQFPEHEDKIQSIESEEKKSDLIPVYKLYHEKSGLIPNGRYVFFIESQILLDAPLPYEKIPLVCLSPENEFEKAFGYSPILELLPIQDAIDTVSSTIFTNNQAFGVQSVIIDKGSGVTVSQVSEGLNFIEVNPGTKDPRPLQLTASSGESYRFLDTLINQSQLLSGINSAVRGEAGANMSGSALALLSQNALQFSNGLQQSYMSLSEDVGTLVISILKQYANTQRISQLAGKHNRPLLKSWSSQDLQGVSRVTIENSNALSRTISGRMQIAQDLLGQGFIKNPEQYLMVLETGRLENVYESESRQLQLMRSENEKLSEGIKVRALITDDHSLHILEHASVLSSPEVRENPDSAIVTETLAHIQEHLTLARSIDPALTQILKQQPVMPVQPAQVPEMLNAQNPVETQSQDVNLPQMPVNKLTGQKFEPQQ